MGLAWYSDLDVLKPIIDKLIVNSTKPADNDNELFIRLWDMFGWYISIVPFIWET